MPEGNEQAYKKMSEIAEALRTMANDLDAMIDEAYRGENEDRFGSSGDVVEGRDVDDISDRDIERVSRMIKISLG